MLKTILAIIMVSAVLSGDLFLTPQYPSTGFYLQYYEVRFRVRGLDYPTFTFTGLPEFFKGSSSGVISGTPDATGTFKIGVKFESGDMSGQENIVINIVPSAVTPASQQVRQEVVLKIVANAYSSWIHRSSENINIQLICQHGKGPYVWNYRNLPVGLKGTADGVIRGSIKQSGLYSFSVNAGDSKGNQATAFYTLNIQPGSIIAKNNIIDVPDRNVPLLYDLEQVRGQQIAADTAVIDTLALVHKHKAMVKIAQVGQAKTQLALNLAINQESHASRAKAEALAFFNAKNQKFAIATERKAESERNVELAETNLDNANKAVSAAEEALEDAKTAFADAQDDLDAKSKAYAKAKQELGEAQAAKKKAEIEVANAKNELSNVFNTLQDLKDILVKAERILAEATSDVENKKNALDLANQANDDAQSHLNLADAALAAANRNLDKFNADAASIRQSWNAAKTLLGGANFNLKQAMNQLYVAQAAKAAADKALNLAYAQGAASFPNEGESSYIFEGCYNQVLPSISGSAACDKLVANGCVLSSGHIVTWGDCTSKTEVIEVGTVVTYNGRFSKGVVSAATIQVKSH